MKNKHAASVWLSGNPVSVGLNSLRNDPRYVQSDLPDGIKSTHYSTHAEVAAMRRARGGVENGTLYVVRVNNQGDRRLSMPCSRCMPKIIKAGIKKVIFTTEDGIGIIKV